MKEAKPPEPHEGAPSAEDQSYAAATVPGSGVIEIRAHRAPMPELCRILGRVLGMPVWDQTGLSGAYDFSFRYSQDASVDVQTDAPPLSTALRENLGLVIRKQRGPLEKLVVDSIEPPSEN